MLYLLIFNLIFPLVLFQVLVHGFHFPLIFVQPRPHTEQLLLRALEFSIKMVRYLPNRIIFTLLLLLMFTHCFPSGHIRLLVLLFRHEPALNDRLDIVLF